MSLNVKSSIIFSFRFAHWQITLDLSERALRPETSQGSNEVDGNPIHLLRHTHSKRGAAGGLLKRKHAHGIVLSQGSYAPVIENGQTIRPK